MPSPVPALLLCIAAASAGASEPAPAAVLATHAELAWRSYGAARAAAAELARRIDAFAAAPDRAGLEACRAAWRAAHDAYSPTEVFRFQDGPIDRDGGPETKLNGWPLDEQWIDATIDDPHAGLVNAGVALTPELLVASNEKDGEKNISTGYHAIEFLLWGQDRNPDGPGDRPVSDFTTAANAQRRTEYLRLAASLLLQHLDVVRDAWSPESGGYRRDFVAGDATTGLTAVFTGLVMLAGDELSGERMAVAYETQDQEEEQSCFSDNTVADIRGDIAGMAMVWNGRLGAWSGTSPRELVAARDAAAAAEMDAALAASIAAGAALTQPFDRAILGRDGDPGRQAVLACIEALEAQADATVRAAAAVGVKLDFGANANNAIVGCKEILQDADRVLAGLQAGDPAAARTAAEAMNKRWLTIESAITAANPILYKEIESALFGLRAAARAEPPRAEAAATRAEALRTAVAKALPLLKQ